MNRTLQGQSMLELSDVNFYYDKVHILKNINMTVMQGEIVSIIGANGAGKTTTLRNISGILAPQSGEILFKGEKIHGLSGHIISRKRIVQVLEGRHIFPFLSVAENLMMGAYARKDKKEIQEDLISMYDMFPKLKERRNQLGETLSGGEQQMLAIARGLMLRPEILLLDEPSLGLAPVIVEDIFETIVAVANKGVTILLVEQNAGMALAISDRGYVMEIGQLVLNDTGKNLLKNENVQKSYLGID